MYVVLNALVVTGAMLFCCIVFRFVWLLLWFGCCVTYVGFCFFFWF